MVERSSWISVGELSDAFRENSHAPSPSRALTGRAIVLQLEDGRTLCARFDTPDQVTFALGPAGRGAKQVASSYMAVELRPTIFFVDFVWAAVPGTTITLLVDMDRQIATVLIGSLPSEAEARRPLLDRVSAGEELTGVSTTFLSAAVDRAFSQDTPRHGPTSEMIGRRMEYTYSSTERYEHIYLNRHFYTWHCLDGGEKGLADTDACHYLKLAEDLYLFVWREKIVPTLGVVVVDLLKMRTAGKILGYAGGDVTGGLANFPVGARARLLNVTETGSEGEG